MTATIADGGDASVHHSSTAASGAPSVQPDQLDIADYAIIGDCRTAALISIAGSIDWLCLPDFSSPSVFAALLDEGAGGRFAIRPKHPYRVARRYVSESNVLETEFSVEGGVVRLTDCMPILAAEEWKRELQPAREVLRIVECIAGSAEIEVLFEPRADYARSRQKLASCGPTVWRLEFRNELFLLHCDVPLTCRGGNEACGTLRLSQGDKRFFSLSYAKGDIAVFPLLGEHAQRRVSATIQWWRGWVGQCRYEGPYRQYVVRSALALKLLAFAQSGAVIAAPTTSLPEEIGGSLNWDYRYCWLRDADFTLTAFMDLGFESEAQAYLNWLLHSTRLTRPRLQVLYDIFGESRLPETELSHLTGYRRSRPVRIGNGAFQQCQLDVYGSVIRAAHVYVERGGQLERSERKLLIEFGEEVCRSWRDPDHGIWEVRGAKRQHTYSKLMCWVALDRILQLQESGVLSLPEGRFKQEREEIRRRIEREGYDEDIGSYRGIFGERGLDASVLRMPVLGFCPADTPRMRSTFARLTQALGRGPLLYRYDQNFGRAAQKEGAFGACGFWAVEYLALLGDRERAHARFSQLLTYANELGLYAEEIEPDSGRALGNFPQAFTHASLINAALTLNRAQVGER